ncbi:ATP-binding protein [Okeania sp. KiyG1]|uniref:ATP-binding protein n=1 Tax=Okeania sp. KiyG1 TaxID=2720165 RepID=UPI001924B689|nr:ATP-binding protein [Okeania sp. KiyG1]GGA39083.1 hypothetical protein CYANOKiyG1_57310 [Okeania sp. KiyG1]
MNTSHNKRKASPYIFGKPILKQEQLYGREQDIKQIKSNLIHNKKITLLEVQRRIGKTSLLKCLPQNMNESEGKFKFVHFSFQGKQKYPIPTILDYLAEEIIEDIYGIPEQEKKVANSLDTFFGKFLPKIINQYLSDEKLVFLIDEFDILGEDEETYSQGKGKDLFDKLEKAIEQENRLFAVLVFGKPVKKITYLESFCKQNPKSIITVTELDKKSTKKLITELAKGTLEYEQEAIEAIWRLLKGHPSLTQLLCKSIFELCHPRNIKIVNPNHVSLSQEKVIEGGRGVLKGFLQPLSEAEKLFFRAVAEAQKRGIVDPLKIIKPTEEIPISALMQAGKDLVEYGFLEEDKTGYKIKVELVRVWLLDNYPLSDEERLPIQEIYQANQNITETNNNGRMPTQNGNNNSQGPNQIYKFFSLLLVPGIFITLIVIFIMRATEPPPICNDLPKEINSKIASGTSEEQLETINKFRQGESLNQQCPNFDEIEGKFYELLHKYGEEKVNDKKFDAGIKTLCSIPDKYAKKTQIKQDINKLIAPNSSFSIEQKRKLINEILEQEKAGNKCPAYSLEDETDKKNFIQKLKPIDKFYEEEAKKQISNNNYQEAVKLYCKISEHYLQLPQIKQQLENWSKDEFEMLILRQDREKIISTLKKIGKDNCPAYPDI